MQYCTVRTWFRNALRAAHATPQSACEVGFRGVGNPGRQHQRSLEPGEDLTNVAWRLYLIQATLLASRRLVAAVCRTWLAVACVWTPALTVPDAVSQSRTLRTPRNDFWYM